MKTFLIEEFDEMMGYSTHIFKKEFETKIDCEKWIAEENIKLKDVAYYLVLLEEFENDK